MKGSYQTSNSNLNNAHQSQFYASHQSILEEEEGIDNTFDFPVQERSIIHKYFSQWLAHHDQEKEKWEKLVKYKYMLQRLKVNKVFLAWRFKIRESKVLKLKESLISHSSYILTQKTYFRNWKQWYRKLKMGLNLLSKLGNKRIKKVIFKYLDYRVKDFYIKDHQAYLAQKNREKAIVRTIYSAMKEFKGFSQKNKSNKIKAQKYNQLNLLTKFFKGIYDFSKMSNKKLESKKKVEAYINEKYRQKIVYALRMNIYRQQRKDVNMRKAIQFQLIRHKHHLVRQAFEALRKIPFLHKIKRIKYDNRIKKFRLQRFFDIFLKGLESRGEDEVTLVRAHRNQLMRLKLFSFWKTKIQNQLHKKDNNNQALKYYERRVCMKMMDRIKFFINKQRELNRAEKKIKRNQEQKLLGLVLQKFNDIQQFKEMRQQHLGRVFENIQHKQTMIAYLRIKSFDWIVKRKSKANKMRKRRQKSKGFRALKWYYERKIQQSINYQLSRKFRYLRLLQNGVNVFKKYYQLSIGLQDKHQLATKQYRRKLVQRLWKQFKEIDDENKYKQKRIIQHVTKQQLKKQGKLFQVWNQQTCKKIEKKQKEAMAYIHYRNKIEKTYFDIFKRTLKIMIKQTRSQNFKLSRAIHSYNKNLFRVAYTSLKLYRKIKKEQEQRLKNLKSKLAITKKLKVFFSIFHYSQQKSKQRQNTTIAYLYWKKMNQHKLISMLIQNSMISRQRRMKNYRALKLWSKTTKRNVFFTFQAYAEYKKQERMEQDSALDQRNKIITQLMIYKLMKVSEYWLKKKGQMNERLTWEERDMKEKFVKWKYVTFQNQVKRNLFPTQKRKVHISSVTVPTEKREEQKYQHFSQKQERKENLDDNAQETVDWLSNFDKRQKKLEQPKDKGALDQYLDKKRQEIENKHQAKLREFDHFLSNLKPQENKGGLDFSVKQNYQNNIGFNENSKQKAPSYQIQNRSMFDAESLTPIKILQDMETPKKSTQVRQSMQNERINKIQDEIQQFLKEKELLRQLEATNSQSQASILMREEILSKSVRIKGLCDELKYLKQQQSYI